MSITINDQVQKGYLCFDYVGEATITALQGAILNPEGVPILITNSYCWLITPSTGAATLNVGHGAALGNDASFHTALPLNGGIGTAWMGLHPAVTMDAALLEVVLATDFFTFTTVAAVSASALHCQVLFQVYPCSVTNLENA